MSPGSHFRNSPPRASPNGVGTTATTPSTTRSLRPFLPYPGEIPRSARYPEPISPFGTFQDDAVQGNLRISSPDNLRHSFPSPSSTWCRRITSSSTVRVWVRSTAILTPGTTGIEPFEGPRFPVVHDKRARTGHVHADGDRVGGRIRNPPAVAHCISSCSHPAILGGQVAELRAEGRGIESRSPRPFAG